MKEHMLNSFFEGKKTSHYIYVYEMKLKPKWNETKTKKIRKTKSILCRLLLKKLYFAFITQISHEFAHSQYSFYSTILWILHFFFMYVFQISYMGNNYEYWWHKMKGKGENNNTLNTIFSLLWSKYIEKQ